MRGLLESAGSSHRFLAAGTPERAWWARYGVAIVCAALGWLGREALTPVLGPVALPFVFLFPAVTAAAWYGGAGPAVLTIALGVLLADLAFMEPIGRLGLVHTADAVALGAFVLSSAVIVAAVDVMHRRRRVAADAGDVLATTLSSIGDGVVVTDGAGRVAFLNPEAERLTGWRADEARGKPLETVFPIVNEDTRRPVDNPVAKVLRSGTIVGLANHTVLLARGGAEVPIDDSAAPVKGRDGSTLGVVLVFRDVTEQRRNQRALAQLGAIVAYSGDAIFTKDLEGVIQTWNVGAERLFGYRPEEVVGEPVHVLVPPERREEERRILASLRAGKPVERLESERVAKDGRRIPVAISVSPLKDSEGEVVGASTIVHDVTEVRAARAALERERELLATTLASIGDAVIVTDLEGRVTFLNPEAARLTGWTTAEAAGRALPEVFRIVDERSRRASENPVERVLRLGSVVGLANHTILLARDGTATPIDDSAAPIRNAAGELFGVVLVFRDITERKRADASLRESEERFRLMADSAPVLIWVAGTDKLCTWFNRQWLEFVGRPMESELGNGWAENVHPDDLARCLSVYTSRFDAREPFAMEYRLRRHDGEYRWLLDNGVPRHGPHGEFAGYIGSCVDITERRRAEESLRRADRRKDEFLATLSHELRNPLAPIRLAVTLLKTLGPPDAQLQALREVIDRQTGQLATLLDDLLEVSRISSGKIALRKARVGLGAALSSAIEASRPLIDASGHELVVQLPAEPIEVDADLVRLAQVFTNLLNNAAKYTERGGRIGILATAEGSEAVVRVRDTGIGIGPDQLSRIFDMFAQVDDSLERNRGGLGVGLALAKTLVELHGGTIEARSAGIGKGSEFVVRLPRAKGPAPRDSAATDGSTAAGGGRARRVLVADDNVDSAATLALLLRHRGHDVRVVNDGRTALDVAASFRPQWAVVDIGMPLLDGYAVARGLRAQFGDGIRLVALTGWGQDEDKRRAAEAGFDHHLTKPADVDRLLPLLDGDERLAGSRSGG